jgi:hypothetical protein
MPILAGMLGMLPRIDSTTFQGEVKSPEGLASPCQTDEGRRILR